MLKFWGCNPRSEWINLSLNQLGPMFLGAERFFYGEQSLLLDTGLHCLKLNAYIMSLNLGILLCVFKKV